MHQQSNLVKDGSYVEVKQEAKDRAGWTAGAS